MLRFALVFIITSFSLGCGEKNPENTSLQEPVSPTSVTSEGPVSQLEKFAGTWGSFGDGALGTCGKNPVIISQDGVKVGNETFPIAFDPDGDIPLMGGATALRSQDKDTLIYLNSDGLELDMKRCK